MVKKIVYNISGQYDHDDRLANADHTEVLHINDCIHHQLVVNKNCINMHHKSRKWDRYKKLTNDYELVFTSVQSCPSIADYNPISRSYFKLWEILCDFTYEFAFPETPMHAVFLADAPGGFGEALINYRKGRSGITDTMYGMSLKATNKVIPNWKFNQAYCVDNNLTLCYGSSGTGNLYNINNIHDLVQTVGSNSTYFVTADGGFDFSSDFNNQEDMSLNLILCEIYTALNIQKEGGSFVLKIYDIHNEATMRLLYILKCFYNNMYFVKPLSSRPANSEKYVVCTEFSKSSGDYDRTLEILRQNIVDFKAQNLLKAVSLPMPFILDIVRFNKAYIANQTLHIIKTLSLIEQNEKNDAAIIRHQVKKALKWCFKYDTKISLNSLKRYKATYFDAPTSALALPISASSSMLGLT
jgi:hypothetical protein